MPMVKKSGYMKRAMIVWVTGNLVILGSLWAVVALLGPVVTDNWWGVLILLLAVVISQWIMMGETVAPVVKDWITQERYVDEEERRRVLSKKDFVQAKTIE